MIRRSVFRRILPVFVLLFAAGAVIIAAGKREKAISAAAVKEPSPCLVIDAGHGGLDGGAVSAEGVKESGINLAVACKLWDVCRLLGVDCCMTRSSEELEYPENARSIREKKVWDQQRRVALANETPGAVLLSIHQNLYPDARPSGTQVLYAATDGSKELGERTHSLLSVHLCPENRRVAAPASDEIYLMKRAQCPAILVECGFLSNSEEAHKLCDPGYQCRLALILCASYIQTFVNAI